MKNYKVLHVSPTPLVDSPRKISEALRYYTDYEASIIIFNDYPGSLKGIFSQNTILYSKQKDLALDIIKNADIIHIHNFLNPEQEEIIFYNSKSNVKYIYQVHSPLREGPNFVKYSPSLINIERHCVISQYHARLYQDSIALPNIILHKPTLNLIKDDELPKVLFSPAHKRVGGRWNDKYSEELVDSLRALEKLNLIKLKIAEGYTPYELHQIRANSHITIDEITTGAFHQISLEGLCAGNVVINNADTFTINFFKLFLDSSEMPPFYKIDNYTVKKKLLQLVSDKSLIREYQQKSYNYYKSYLDPAKLIKNYEKLYDEVLNDI